MTRLTSFTFSINGKESKSSPRVVVFLIILIHVVRSLFFGTTHNKGNEEALAGEDSTKYSINSFRDFISYPGGDRIEGMKIRAGFNAGSTSFNEWQATGDSIYVHYIKKNLDHYIGEDGTIHTYRFDDINWITSHQAKLCSVL